MGNSIRRVGLLNTVGAGEDEPFHYTLGRKVSIDLSKRLLTVKRGGRCSEKWIMSYEVDLSTCTFTLTKSGKDDLFIDIFSEVLDQDGYFSKYTYYLDVQTVIDSDSLLFTRPSRYVNGSCLPPMNQYGRQIHGGGRVTETHFWLCGTGDIGSLTVLEEKMMMEEKRPHEVTLAHYFSTRAGINDFSRNSIKVGLSVVVKIRASHGNLDITVEGPDQHPPSGLRYLFDEAIRRQIWKPTLCPHCASIQKQRSKMIFPSDSDDSESVPWARRHGGCQKNSRGVDNGGKFNGNGNGIFPSDTDDSESVPWARRHGGCQKNSRGVDNGGKFNGNGNGIFPSDTDDSESVPWARRHGGNQKNSRGVDNGGKFNGNGNGNYNEYNVTIFGGRWRN